MRLILFFASLAAVVALVVFAVQLQLDRNANPELYGFRTGGYEAYQQTIRPVYNTGDFYIVEITKPLQVNMSFEEFTAEVVEHNRLADEHYRDFISVKFYLFLLTLAVWLAIRMIDLEVDNAEMAKKLKGDEK